MSDYDTIMESITDGDIVALEGFHKLHGDFPTGKDKFLERHWITNAIDCGTVEVVEWMVTKNASLRFRDDEGYTVLHSALERNEPEKYEMLRLLIKAGANIDAKGVNDYTPAHKAAADSDIEGLRILVEAGADLTIKTRIDEYETPLGEAIAMKSSQEVIEYLQQNS